MSQHSIPPCPQCGLTNTYPDGASYICPDCAFEWPMQAEAPPADTEDTIRISCDYLQSNRDLFTRWKEN